MYFVRPFYAFFTHSHITQKRDCPTYLLDSLILFLIFADVLYYEENQPIGSVLENGRAEVVDNTWHVGFLASEHRA